MAIDDQAYHILLYGKEKAKERGINKPSFSDAVRALINIQTDDIRKEFEAFFNEYYKKEDSKKGDSK